MPINFHAAWIGFLLGALAGMTLGLFFHKADWLGGYASWPRRMLRLGHIAWFGIAFLNLGFALSVEALPLGTEPSTALSVCSVLLIVGGVTMPLVCYLSAWRAGLRMLFPIPALAATAAIALFLWIIMGVTR